ncbi:MAG: recombinase family protein [Polyangiaceae bacterium]
MWRRTAKANTTQRATIAYIRVSTEEQARHGVSLAAQEARIAAYALAMGWEVSEVIRDAGESAKSLQRPGIDDVLGRVQRGEVERVVILKLDRFLRSGLGDLEKILAIFAEHDAALVSVTEQLDTKSAAGRLVVNVLASIAKWEREAIGERTAFALAHKRKSGQVYGHAPFGYRIDGTSLVPIVEELDALKEARAMYDAGSSLRKIAAMFEARGIKPRGQRWYSASVRKILHSRMSSEVT